jgi:hypothetical protein
MLGIMLQQSQSLLTSPSSKPLSRRSQLPIILLGKPSPETGKVAAPRKAQAKRSAGPALVAPAGREASTLAARETRRKLPMTSDLTSRPRRSPRSLALANLPMA